MLEHLPASPMASSETLAWVGAAVLLLGEIAALPSLPNLIRRFVISTVAEVGHVLIGLGLGGRGDPENGRRARCLWIASGLRPSQ